jgi:hypothetical protein
MKQIAPPSPQAVKFEFVMKSQTATVAEVVDHVNDLKKQAFDLDENRKRAIKKRKIFISQVPRKCSYQELCDLRGGGSEGQFRWNYLESTATFENFYSEEAQQIYNDVKNFQENRMHYDDMGRPWTYTYVRSLVWHS